MVEAYSTCSHTRVLYAKSFTDSFLVLTFLFINPRVPFALPVILASLTICFCARTHSDGLMVIPKYFAYRHFLRFDCVGNNQNDVDAK